MSTCLEVVHAIGAQNTCASGVCYAQCAEDGSGLRALKQVSGGATDGNKRTNLWAEQFKRHKGGCDRSIRNTRKHGHEADAGHPCEGHVQ